MSGIFGLFNLDGAPVDSRQLDDIASLLQQRGPDRTGIWRAGSIGLGHTLLATSPEAVSERLPHVHEATGCVITADVRLDNRDELLALLGVSKRRATIGDGEIVLAAYLRFGESCAEHLVGDFAFAVWDPRVKRLFCARDRLGMRQLIYHFSARRTFAFATGTRAILVLPQVPFRINEARIADFLMPELEGIDTSSTFFEDVFRLPPAHTLTVSTDRIVKQRYWTLQPTSELHLRSDAAYVEAFRDVFDTAVRCRLRTVGPVGSMLSGGVDSGTAAATARLQLQAEGRGPLHTFSAVSPDSDAETQAINTALTMDGLEPTIISSVDLGHLRAALEEATIAVEEPFDISMTVIQAVYLSARSNGLKALMDGAGGDMVFPEGRYLARMLRAGNWRAARNEAIAQNRFWGGSYPPWPELARGAAFAFAPQALLEPVLNHRRAISTERRVSTSLIDPDFARAVSIHERLHALATLDDRRLCRDAGRERAAAIEHPYLTVGRERYDRVAGANGIEPRDPYTDARLVEFCARLPDSQVFGGGWPKLLLRRAGADRLPTPVRWRRGKENPGWAFAESVLAGIAPALWDAIEADPSSLSRYVDPRRALPLIRAARTGNATAAEKAYDLAGLAAWLKRHADRPKGTNASARGAS